MPPLRYTKKEVMRKHKVVYKREQRRMIGRFRLAVCILLMLGLIAVGIWLVRGCTAKGEQPAPVAESVIESPESEQPEQPDQTEQQSAPEQDLPAEEQASQLQEAAQPDVMQQITDAATVNATKNQPQIEEYSLWQTKALEILNGLVSDPYYASCGFSLTVQQGYPYLLAVNRAASTVTVYTVDENGEYTVPFMAMACSGGEDTPLGYWGTPVSYDWRLLAGPCYGQYATRIFDCFLFHSVPYYTQHQDDVEYDQFNQLGSLASLGCIRLAVVDVKWIYDNCPIGTPVIIYDDAQTPGPMGKPGTIYTDPADTALRGWDPTDPCEQNPWPESYRIGTAIRSPEALSQWQECQSVWAVSVNIPVLQGFSTDSGVEGTRG